MNIQIGNSAMEDINLAQLYLDVSSNMMVAIDNHEVITEINKKGSEILGYKREEIIGKNWFDNFIPDRIRAELKPFFHQYLDGKLRLERYENPVLTKSGEERIISFDNIFLHDKDGKIVGTLSAGEDVTERKRAEKALKESEARFQAALNAMLEGYQIIDYQWRYLYLNDAAAAQWQRTKQELIGHTMMEMYPGIENTPLLQNLEDCMKNRVSRQMQNEFTFPNGTKGWFELHIEPAPDGIVVLSIDVTRRREIESELKDYRVRLAEAVSRRAAEIDGVNNKLELETSARQKAEASLLMISAIANRVPAAVSLIDLNGKFLFANEEICRLYGYSCGFFIGVNFRDAGLITLEEEVKTEPELKKLLATGENEFESVHYRRDKTRFPVSIHSVVVEIQSDRYILSVTRDISQEKK